jgi:hypothetical protein
MNYAKEAPIIELSSDLALVPAVLAWTQMRESKGLPATPPTAVRRLKPKRLKPLRKSEVYRLDGAGDAGAAVVAKRCLVATATTERTIYERLLPRLSISTLPYYGYLAEDEGKFCWLFIGDAGDRLPEGADRPMAARWLAQLHGEASQLARSIPLPNRGPDHYLRELRTAREYAVGPVRNLGLSDDDARVFDEVLQLTASLEKRWADACVPCAASPQTLVHGDFSGKNVRVRATPEGLAIVALDWETAGWGPPATDLTRWPRRSAAFAPPATELSAGYAPNELFEEYLAALRNHFPWVTRDDIEGLSRIGTVFRLLSGVRWATERVIHGGVYHGMVNLRVCVESLTWALPAAGL